MLVLIKKASDDDWYQFKNINTLEEVLKIAPTVIVSKNKYTKSILKYWEGFKQEDIPKLEQAKIKIMIYDDWIE